MTGMAVRALFIHRSVGLQMLQAASVRTQIQGVDFCDVYANDNTFTDEHGNTGVSQLDFSAGNTNPDGLATFFAEAVADQQQADFLASFQVIGFKSCYSASAINSDDELAAHQRHYDGAIATYIEAHPDKRFVIVSPPPRRRLLSNRAAATRARAFSEWLEGFASRHANCQFFDLFGLLADSSNLLDRKFHRLAPYDQHPNRRGAELAGRGLQAAYERASAQLAASRA